MILSDPNVEIRRATEAVMGEFLKEIAEHPDKVDFAAMVNILIQHSQPKQVGATASFNTASPIR